MMEVFHFKMLIADIFVAEKRGLQSHRFLSDNCITHHSPRSFPFVHGQAKITLIKRKFGIQFTHNQSHFSCLYFIIGLTSIKKGSQLPTVPVQINEVINFVFFTFQTTKQSSDTSNNWIEKFIRISCPPTINISSTNIATRISIYNSININHWNDFKDIVLKQVYRILIIRIEEGVNKAFHHIGRDCLARVLPCNNSDDFLPFSDFFLVPFPSES